MKRLLGKMIFMETDIITLLKNLFKKKTQE